MSEKKKVAKPLKPTKLWAIVDEKGQLPFAELYLTKADATNVCLPEENERVVRVLVTEVPRG